MADLRDLFGTGDPDEYRKKLALALTQQGLDSSPIRSPWQGAARLAQALVGASQMNDLQSENANTLRQQADAERIKGGLPPLGGIPNQSIIQMLASKLGGGGDNPATPPGNDAGNYGGSPATNANLAPMGEPAPTAPMMTRGLPSPMPPAPSGPMAGPAGPPAPGSFNDRWAGVTDAVRDGTMDPVGQNYSQAFAQAPGQTPAPMMPSPNGPGTFAPMIGGPPPERPPAMTQASPPAVQAGLPAPVPPQGQQAPQGAPQGQGGGLRQVPTMPPEVTQRIDQLTRLGTKAGLQQAQLLSDTYQKKALDQVRPLTDPAERTRMGIQPTDTNPYQIDATGKVHAVNPQPFAVNVNQQGQSEFEKHYGEGMGKRALEVLDAGDKAAGNIQNNQLMRDLLANVKTGKLTPVGATIGSWLQAAGLDPKTFGIDPALPASAEALGSLANKMALANIGGPGGIPANNFSEADRKFVTTLVPSLAQRPEANAIMLDVAERTNRLSMERADKWAEARAQGTSYEKFERDWRRELGTRNIFGDLAQKIAAIGGGAPDPSQSPPPAAGQPRIRTWDPASGTFK